MQAAWWKTSSCLKKPSTVKETRLTSPARRHFERISAAQAAADAGEAPMQGEAFELMQAALFEDYRRLKATQSIERKIEIKREILPHYADYIAGVLEAGQGAQDDVLMRIMSGVLMPVTWAAPLRSPAMP